MHVHYQSWWMDELFVRHGITTIRDVGANLDQVLEPGAQAASRIHPPAPVRLCPCSTAPRRAHGHHISRVVTTPEEARAVARERLLARQVDCLKVYEQPFTPPLSA